MPISQVKAEKPKMESDTSPRVPRLAMKKPRRDLAYRVAEEKHTGDGPGFKIIDMKLINDEGSTAPIFVRSA